MFHKDIRLMSIPVFIAIGTGVILAACNSGSKQIKQSDRVSNKSYQESHYCQYAYITHNRTNDIAIFGVNLRTGNLERLNFPLVPTGNNPGSFYAHPSGKFVYIVSGGENLITAYRVNRDTGELFPIQTIRSPGVMLWGGTLTPKSGKFLYVCNNNSNNIAMFKIDPDTGLLTLNKTAIHPDGIIANAENANGPNSVKITANLKWAYVGNYNSNNITVYHYDDNTGDLLLAKNKAISIPDCAQPRQLTLSPAAVPSDPLYIPSPKQLYALCQRSNTIVQLDLDSDQLIDSNTKSYVVSTNGVGPTSMTIEAQYKYAYVPNMQSSTVAQFAIESNLGFLTSLQPPVVAAGVEAKGIYTNMGYAYVTNFAANSLSTFRIESNGTLTKSSVDIPTGGVNPGGITFTPVIKGCEF